MNSKITKLLQQRKNPGEAIGKALLHSLAHDLRNPDKPPLITQQDLDIATDRIISDVDQQAYNAYVELYNTVSVLYNHNEALGQQAQNGYYRILWVLTGVQAGEDGLRLRQGLPVLAVPAKAKATWARLAREGASQPLAVAVARWLSLRIGGEDAGMPPPVRRALAALQDVPFDDPALLAAIPGLWQAGPQKPLTPAYSAARLLAYCGKLYRGEPAPEAMLLTDTPADPPPGLTQWDVLADPRYTLLSYYSGQMTGEYTQALAAFAGTFGPLMRALWADMRAQPGAEGLPEDPDGGVEVSEKTLAALGIATPCAWEPVARARARAVLEEGDAMPALPDAPPGLEALGADKEQCGHLRMAREELLIPALRRMYANNTILTLLGERAGVPELRQLRVEPVPTRAQLQTLDNQTALLCRAQAPLGPRTAGDARRTALARTHFPALSELRLEPEAATVEAVRALLTANGTQVPPLSVLLAMLCPEEEGAHG